MWNYGMFITVILEFIVSFVGELVDFWRKWVCLVKQALAEGHLFFYNLLVVIKSIGIYFCLIRKLYRAPTHPDAFPKWHFSIAGSLMASWNFIE